MKGLERREAVADHVLRLGYVRWPPSLAKSRRLRS
jgi:hypothetical protein